jgi:hypothetical protein
MIHLELTRRDQRDIPEGRDEIRLFCVLRDEVLRLPYFIDYYRRLGVDRFFMINNNSIDESESFLLQQPDCHVFYTGASYGASRAGVTWLNSLMDAYGEGRWIVLADTDELLVYPHCEQAKLPKFCTWLDQQGSEGVYTLLLDMYSKLPIKDVAYKQGEDFLNACPCFDKDYAFVSRIGVPVLRPAFPPFEHIGGPRLRLCFAEQNTGAVWPRLKVKLLRRLLSLAHSRGLLKNIKLPIPATQAFKVPLVKWRKGDAFVTSHRLNAIKLSPVRGALLHFKYFQDFSKRVQDAVQRGEHFNGSAEYKRYAELLAAKSDLTLAYKGSTIYHDSDDLLKLGLIKTIADWKSV